LRTRSRIILCAGLLVACAAGASGASAAEACPGHPDALGTSRTIMVDPREHPLIGTMQYRETLPLRDHEVVLTFDDGPLPRNSNQVLKILADECIKATFFIIGEQAKASPDGVRKLVAAGHTVGTHSMTHPLTFERMPIDKAEAEINGGIQWTSAAMSDPSALAPFFRIPGLLRAEGVEKYLISRGIQVWSADFPADDWRHISSERVHQLAIQRLEAKGKGILLLHDIQARTVAALPKIIQDLKTRGYHIVHVEPATPERPATPTEAVEWLLRPPSESVPVAHWPAIPNFVFAQTETLPTPALADLNAELPFPAALPARLAEANVGELPVPGRDLFEIPEKSLNLLLTTAFRHGMTARSWPGDPVRAAQAVPAARHGKAVASHGRARAHVARTAPKRPAQAKNIEGKDTESMFAPATNAAPPTRVAGLKKR
jgi:peptidoglycan/xylan/chitin deacetylase (PgdA/CDA1 family)